MFIYIENSKLYDLYNFDSSSVSLLVSLYVSNAYNLNELKFDFISTKSLSSSSVKSEGIESSSSDVSSSSISNGFI